MTRDLTSNRPLRGRIPGGRCAALALLLIAACGGPGKEPLPAPVAPRVPEVGGCPVFTADDPWNTPIARAKPNAEYTARLKRYLAKVGEPSVHADFGGDYEGEPFGLPFNVVPESQPLTPVFFEYADESDPGPYPFPLPDQVLIEGGNARTEEGDRYILVLQQGTCQLFEAWGCQYDTQWRCGIGASFDLRQNSYGQRPKGQPAAGTAGVPILAGLVRYAEVAEGEIHHALRFALDCTSNEFTAPASHNDAPRSCDENDPDGLPMGLRIRLPESHDISHLEGSARVVAQAMKTYGMILALHGSDFFIEGEPDARWSDEELNALKDIPSTAFEVVDPVSPEP